MNYTAAVGLPEEQAKTYNVEAGTNFVLSETDALNRTTAYTYDSMGNVTSVTRLSGTADAVTTTATYEPVFNKLTSVTDPLNHTTTFGYDAKGNLITLTNPLNQTTTITRNPEGQATAITDPLNNTTQYTYDFGDYAGMTDALGNASTRFTDSAGRVLGVTDPLGNISIYDYDVLNRLTKVTDPISGQTNFTYDPNGNLLSVTDARSSATVYTYDNMDRLATRRDPLLRTETHLYDLSGNRSQFTDRKSQVATYSYDGLDRRTGVTYADTSTTGFTLDKGDRLMQVNDSISGTITRTYDGLNQLTSETTPQGSVSYTYDAVGRRTSMTVAGQTAVNYSYDNTNRLTQITQGSSTVTYTYDAAGRRTSVTLPNNVLVEYGYDIASRLTSITYKQNGSTVLGNLTYEYDKSGSRTKTGGSFARTGVPQVIASTAYNAANHQTTFGDKTLTYDNNGNLQTITDPSGTTTYTWNARNQLTGISGPGVSASLVYDGFGRREKKTINGNVTEFLYDGLNPVQETSGATILANILPGLGIDEFLTRTDVVAGVSSHFLTNALGSPVAVTDNAGTVQTEYTYEPFGTTTLSGASNSSSYQYTGRENDGTGLYYYRARFYHPQLQRFLSEDPIEFQGGDINLYAYVWNAPLDVVDPEGFGGTMIIGGKGGSMVHPNPARYIEPANRYIPPAARRLGPETKPHTPTPEFKPPPTPDKLGWPNSGQAEGHAPHEVEHGGCLTPFGCGGGGHGGIVPPIIPPGGGRKDPPPFPGCSLGLSILCPDPRA
jgi:RHS repeat-associated protein